MHYINLPFIRKDDTSQSVEVSDVESRPESGPNDLHDSADLSQIENESLRAKILSMLSFPCYRSIETCGDEPSEITATEPGLKGIAMKD